MAGRPKKEKTVSRNLTLPESFAKRLDALREKRGGVSESEIFRQSISLLDLITDSGKQVILRNKETGEETLVIVP
jgi:hypothetical protein